MSHNTESVLKGAFAQERDFDGHPAKISYHAKVSRETAWRRYEQSRNRRAPAQRTAARIVDPVPPELPHIKVHIAVNETERKTHYAIETDKPLPPGAYVAQLESVRHVGERDQSEDREQPKFVVAYFPDGKVGYGEGKWGVLRSYDLELYDGMFVDAADATAMAVKREKQYSEGGDY